MNSETIVVMGICLIFFGFCVWVTAGIFLDAIRDCIDDELRLRAERRRRKGGAA